jgi:hypothetical protein
MKEILKNLVVYNPVNKKIRLGRLQDGGYVIVDGYNYDYFISGGIGGDISFENDFIKINPNIRGLAFDGTVTAYQSQNLPKEIKFIKKNIGFDDNETTTNLHEYIKNYKNVFIKMDIEGGEWNLLRSSFSDLLLNIKQIVFEAHSIFTINNVLECLQIINKTHYLIHVHQNNNGILYEIENAKYPSLLELTYIRKDCEISGLNANNLPIEGLDFTNMPEKPEYDIMNKYPFNSKIYEHHI